jgi:hypothetical protein
MPTLSICGACCKVFTSTTLFDTHRIGEFEKPIYAETDTGKKKVIGYQPPTRRCMTPEELQAAGYQMERRSITVFHEGQAHQVEREVWYDPAARTKMQQVFKPVPVEAQPS